MFFLCGLWHGASWTFVVWGLYHGVFLVLERTRFGVGWTSCRGRCGMATRLLVVMVGWVLFRADTFRAASAIFYALSCPAMRRARPTLARYYHEPGSLGVCVRHSVQRAAVGPDQIHVRKAGRDAPAICRPAVQIFGSVLEIAADCGCC